MAGQVGGTLSTPVPSFAFPGNAVNGPSNTYVAQISNGSPNLGVPGNNSLSSSAGTSNPVADAVSSGQQAANSAPTNQPVFWAVVLMIVAVVMFAHIARVEIK